MSPGRLIRGLLAAAMILGAGCTSEEARQAGSPMAKGLAEGDAFGVSVTLCRKVGSKSGRRIGAGHEFTVAKKSGVKALVDFSNAKTDRTYTIHLVWIRPDGREMFRRFAEARPTTSDSGESFTMVRWLDAEDLHKVKVDSLAGTGGAFTLDSRLNISRNKNRTPGEYRFRVYLDRALLKEETFTVLAEEG